MEYEITISINGVRVSLEEYRKHDFSRSPRHSPQIKEVEIKDKQYDSDLKKLDTEHNALQTEYDSIKTVLEKNVERSFKAFNG